MGHNAKLWTFDARAARFWAGADQPATGCWTWRRSKTKHGYGQIRWYGVSHFASRVAWLIAYGDIPDGLFVCHTCDNPSCIRPDHLFLGTNSENIKDAASKNRLWFQKHPERISWRGKKYGAERLALLRGEASPCAKLTWDDISAIRASYKYRSKTGSSEALARKYGVSPSLIFAIVKGKVWKEEWRPISA